MCRQSYAVVSGSSRGCSVRLRDNLYGVFVESCIISFSLLSGLAVAVEMLVTLEIIQAPAEKQNNVVNKTSSQLSTSTTTRAIDPGGSTTDPLHITTLVCHYISLGIAALFLFEILLKMLVTRKAFFVQFWQIFDAFVVVGAFSVEVVFSVLGKEVVWDEAATFVVLLRLWRVVTVCNINAKKTKSDLEQEIYELKSIKTKYEGKTCSQQDRLDRQQLKIVELERRITALHHEEKMPFDSPDQICNGVIAIRPLDMPIIVSAITASETEEFWGENTLDTNDSHAVESRSDESVNLLKSEVDDVEDADEVTEVGGQHHSDGETDTNEDEQSVDDVDDVVQIDEHPIVETEDTTKLIDEIPTSETYENEVFDKEDEEIVERDLPVLAKHGDGTKTYRSAEGIPMTTL